MRQVGSLVVVIVLACASSGCDGFTLFVSTGPLPHSHQSPTVPPPPRPIVLGDVVHGTFIVPEVRFDLIAPRTGLLFIRLSWDRRHGFIDLAFTSTVLPLDTATTTDGAIVGTVAVTAGQTYRILVVGQHGPVPFTLTTSLD